MAAEIRALLGVAESSACGVAYCSLKGMVLVTSLLVVALVSGFLLCSIFSQMRSWYTRSSASVLFLTLLLNLWSNVTISSQSRSSGVF